MRRQGREGAHLYMKRVIRIKGVAINEGRPVVCVPIVAETQEEILRQAEEFAGQGARMLEWRLDFFERIRELEAVLAVLFRLQEICEHVVLLVTIRSEAQGGNGQLRKAEYEKLLLAMAESHQADMLDVEFFAWEGSSELIRKIRREGAVVIASHHDFQRTPSRETLLDLFERMREGGADLVKIAAMPECPADVLTLLEATEAFHAAHEETPVVSMSMGSMGLISRAGGELWGSCVTFGVMGKSSAPGQPQARELERVLDFFAPEQGEEKRAAAGSNIYLVGFMGAGKTTVARALERALDWPLIDTDERIVRQEGKSIAEIFADDGEEAFRRIETETLRDLSREGKRIISCGGGVAMREENRRIMKASGTTILLEASPETILERVRHDDRRPLLRGRKTVEGIRELLEERMPAYRLAADDTVTVDHRTPEEVARKIMEICGL